MTEAQELNGTGDPGEPVNKYQHPIDFSRVNFRKSSKSGNHSDNCVDVGSVEYPGIGHIILVRDSKDPQQKVLRFTPNEWSAFLEGAQYVFS